MNKVFFVGANKLLTPFINSAVSSHRVVVQTTTPFIELNKSIIFIRCTLVDFGLSKLFGFFNLQTAPPFLYKGLT